jgi:hypothetical protein
LPARQRRADLLIAGMGEASIAWVAVAGFALTLALQRFVAGT